MSVTSLFEVSVYAGLWVPYPLTDRDFHVSVRGLDLLDEHGCLLILFESADADGGALPAAAAGRVRMAWRSACLRLAPLPGGGTSGALFAHVDPRMPGDIEVPRTVVSWAMRVLCPFIFSAACRLVAGICATPGCVYAARMAANPALYDLVARREAECRARLPPAAAPAAAPAEAAPRRGYMPSFLAFS